MALPTISADDLTGKGITGMPANPELSVADLQAKFDELSIDVIVPKIQALVTALENASAGADLGVTVPTGITASNKVKSVLDAISVILLDLRNSADTEYTPLVSLFTGISEIVNIIDGFESSIPTCKAVAEYVQDMGGGDMVKSIYDTDNNGVVDDSERLGGQLPAYYATNASLTETNNALSDAEDDITVLTPVVLWQNPNPALAFPPQTVAISENISGYKYYEIINRGITIEDFVLSTGKIPISSGARILDNPDGKIRIRLAGISGTTATFAQSYIINPYGVLNGDTGHVSNIPVQIIGYK